MSKKETLFPINTFGGRIQFLRKKNGFTRLELYNEIFPEEKFLSSGSREKTIYNWESGRNAPRYDDLVKLCAIFDCSADFLLGIRDNVNKSYEFINDVTGLSDESIDVLHKRHEMDKQLHNYYIELLNDYRAELMNGNIDVERKQLLLEAVPTTFCNLHDLIIRKGFVDEIESILEVNASLLFDDENISLSKTETIASYRFEKDSVNLLQRIKSDPEVYAHYYEKEERDFQERMKQLKEAIQRDIELNANKRELVVIDAETEEMN